MSKRLHEEPLTSSKRTTHRTSSDQHAVQKLRSAQSAIYRLDFKTAHEICTEMIRAGTCDIESLLLRSITLEREGQLEEALKDVETALREERSVQTHSRAGYAYLEIAIQHFRLAKEKAAQEQQEDSPRTSQPNFGNIVRYLTTAKVKELKSPFNRASPELLVRIFSFCDAPSLARCQAVCKGWEQSISTSVELFRSFEMEGKGSQLSTGLEIYGQKCNDTMERVVLRVKEKLSSSKQQRLGFTILQSSKNLKVISISHQSDLCKLVVSVAEQCASLSRLESVRMNHEKSLSGTSSRAPVLSFSSKWRPQLHTLIWTCGAESLLCDEVLLERLRGARKVSISSYNLGLPWIVRLLARGSNLIDVRLRGNEKDAVENIPQMNLPNLEQLYLGKTPKSRSTGDSRFFFQSLKTPKLATLSLGGTVPEDLSFLTSESVPQQLVIDDLLIASSVSLPEAASSLVKSLKGMKELQALHLRFTASNSFWVHLLSLLTPLSKANIQDDQQHRVLLPQLISLEIGKEDICKHSTPLDPIHITSLLAARKAALNGCSFDQVSLVASGQSLEPSGALQEAAFETSKLTSQLRALRVEVPVKSDQKKQSWLKKNVFKVNVKWI